MRPLSMYPRAALWRRWLRIVTLGEIIGFSVPTLAAVAVIRADGSITQAAVMVVAGVAEGTILGFAQAYALRPALPWVSTLAWTLATAAGAAVAWLIGALPVVLGDRFLELPPAVLALLGLILLVSMGGLQWLVLRPRVPRAAWWIAATAGSWLAALGAFIAVTTPLWQEGQPVWLTAAIGILGGAVMAAAVAALTGLAFLHLVRLDRTTLMEVASR